MVSYTDTKDFMSDTKFYESYSRYVDGKYETWDEAVSRVMNMHREHYAAVMTPELSSMMDDVQRAYSDKKFLGAQRALQFGGEQLLKHQMKIYNCVSGYADRPEFFGEIFYILLCGSGAGFSVQKHHVSKLPSIKRRTKQPKTHVVEDSIEGWATALDVLLSSYFIGGGKHPEYEERRVYFDLNEIRPKGALISGGFKAPGPEPLRLALDKIEYLLQGLVINEKTTRLRPIDVYDIVMHAADAVLSGGVRRSATICMFSHDDVEMLNAKTGDWFVKNKQRARSNNSAVIIRDEITREEFSGIMNSIKEFGEPGFVFSDSRDITYNPCVSGDTELTVRDHDLIHNGLVLAEGVTYTLSVKDYVDSFVAGDINPLVLSYNTVTNEREFAVVSAAALTRKNADLIELTLDDGKVIKLTPDHKVFTHNRGWIEAKDLTESDDLEVINNE